MMNLSNVLLIALLAAASSADINCGDGQKQIINGFGSDQVTVCCPGVMKTKGTTAYCCVGGKSDGCGKTTCFDDTSSCKALINVKDSDYVKKMEDAAGVKPRRPGHPDDSDAIDSGSGSGSSPDSGESSSAGTTAVTTTTETATVSQPCHNPTSTMSNSAATTDNGAVGNNHPILTLLAGFAAVPAIMYSL